MFMHDATEQEKDSACQKVRKVCPAATKCADQKQCSTLIKSLQLGLPEEITECLGPGVARLLIDHLLSGEEKEITPIVSSAHGAHS